jgi:hypothetical protein
VVTDLLAGATLTAPGDRRCGVGSGSWWSDGCGALGSMPAIGGPTGMWFQPAPADPLQGVRVSRNHSVDVPGRQPLFLNAATVGETHLSARALLDVLLGTGERGRERPSAPRAARSIRSCSTCGAE